MVSVFSFFDGRTNPRRDALQNVALQGKVQPNLNLEGMNVCVSVGND